MTKPATTVYEDTIPAGCHWSLVIPAGHTLQLVDVEGGANIGMLLYNARQPLERLNIPDTLKCQHTFQLTTGHCLYSDMGRVFCSIIEDTFGWHDSVCGTSDRTLVEKRWGKRTYQQARNAMQRNGRDSFLIELAKQGLGKKDLAANMNWFSKVIADADGNIHLEKNTVAGASLTLLFEMETLVIFHSCPHPLDTSTVWPAKSFRYAISKATQTSVEYPAVLKRDENRRGLLNNRLYQLDCCNADSCATEMHGAKPLGAIT
jgi:urea carboxylase-associated protein 2